MHRRFLNHGRRNHRKITPAPRHYDQKFPTHERQDGRQEYQLASALCAAEDTPKFYGAGFVTFTDQAKMKILSVSQQSLERYSAVSEKVAAEMATGAIERADADVSIAITGYGGPEGGEDGTPAGTVWFAWHIKGQTYTAVMHFAGDCETVLALAVRFALVQLLQLLL